MGQTISYTTTEHDLDLGDKGAVRGLQYDQKARRYAGIPYALPPTGARRWRKPEPLPPSHAYRSEDGAGPYDATRFRGVCPQKVFHAVESEEDPNTYSEDCLFVNIWTPVEKKEGGGRPGDDKSKKWPVELWLHGGWFQMGDPSHGADMDPTELISTGGLGAVVVAIGYRLNIFGFLAGHALLEESGGASAGNFGLWDQRLAIDWVKAHIGLFGGDPDNITLAGRSAGAYSVEAQMLYDFRRTDAAVPADARDLAFHRVFMCSNAIPAQPKRLADVDAQFDEVCAHFGLDDHQPPLSGPERLARLRAVPTADLVAALASLRSHTFRPVTDDLFFHAGMYDYLRSPSGLAAEFRRRRGFRLLVGEVANEETLYATYNSPAAPTRDALRAQLENYYAPELTARILDTYALPAPGAGLDEWKRCFGRIVSDGQVRAPSRVLVRALLEGGVPLDRVWRYHIAYRLSFITDKVAPIDFGVAHATDRPIWK